MVFNVKICFKDLIDTQEFNKAVFTIAECGYNRRLMSHSFGMSLKFLHLLKNNKYNTNVRLYFSACGCSISAINRKIGDVYINGYYSITNEDTTNFDTSTLFYNSREEIIAEFRNSNLPENSSIIDSLMVIHEIGKKVIEHTITVVDNHISGSYKEFLDGANDFYKRLRSNIVDLASMHVNRDNISILERFESHVIADLIENWYEIKNFINSIGSSITDNSYPILLGKPLGTNRKITRDLSIIDDDLIDEIIKSSKLRMVNEG